MLLSLIHTVYKKLKGPSVLSNTVFYNVLCCKDTSESLSRQTNLLREFLPRILMQIVILIQYAHLQVLKLHLINDLSCLALPHFTIICPKLSLICYTLLIISYNGLP